MKATMPKKQSTPLDGHDLVNAIDEHGLAMERLNVNVALLNRLAHGEIAAPDRSDEDQAEHIWCGIEEMTERMRGDLEVLAQARRVLAACTKGGAR